MTKTPSKRPNVLWIFGDQHRAQALGCHGDPNLHTPNIDILAGRGLMCQGIGGSPLCCPYRGSLLSSRYPHQCVPGHEYPYPDGMPTVAQPFNDAGYHTAYIGKWHVDGHHERDGRGGLHNIAPQRRGGFGQWLGYENNNDQWDCYVHGHDDAGNEIPRYRLRGYETDELTNLTLDYLDQRAADDQPFFCVLSVQPPHDPFQAPPEFQGRHTPGELKMRPNVPNIPHIEGRARDRLAGYYAMIENLDWNVGRLVDGLRERGLLDHTHVIFFSDHGDMQGSHGQFAKTGPYEESLRVPMIFGGLAGRYGHGTGRSSALINHVDLGPTSLGLCGIDIPDWMQGTDYSHLRLKDRPKRQTPDSAYCGIVVPTGHGDSVDRPWRAVVTTDGWKYVCLPHTPWLMFDLNTDPYEQVNLAHNSRFAAKRLELNEKLAKWVVDTNDAFPLPDVATRTRKQFDRPAVTFAEA